MKDSVRFLKETILSQCKYPPRLVYGKSVWAELFIDSEDYLCIQGSKNYIPTIKMSEITGFGVEDNYGIYILAEYEFRPIVIGFACFDTGIRSFSHVLYGSFSISASGSREIRDYQDGGELRHTFSHIDPDREADCETAISILASWRKQPAKELMSNIGLVPDISDQVLKILDDWETQRRISKQKCFQKISKLMADNGIESLEDAVNIDIAKCYIEWFDEYKTK